MSKNPCRGGDSARISAEKNPVLETRVLEKMREEILSSDSNSAAIEEEDMKSESDQVDKSQAAEGPVPSFSVGDHIYKWVSFAGIPGMSQRHGLVVSIDHGELTILDFHALLAQNGPMHKIAKLKYDRHGKPLQKAKEVGGRGEWKPVKYKASWLERHTWSSGTCTGITSDPPGLVMSRAQFLQNYPEHLPPPQSLKVNSECLGVWCKTGTWATLQTAMFLHVAAAGQAKSAATLALTASAAQVTVPSSGVWGALGFTKTVSLISTQPMLLPAIAGYGVVTIVGPFYMLQRCKKDWKKTTNRLNDAFWESAIDKPDLFVECITEWSQL